MNFQKISITKEQLKVKYTSLTGHVFNIDLECEIPQSVLSIFRNLSHTLAAAIPDMESSYVYAEELLIDKGMYKVKGYYDNDFLASEIKIETPYLVYETELKSDSYTFAVRENGELLPRWGADVYNAVQKLLSIVANLLEQLNKQMTIDELLPKETEPNGEF
jgi:hypothetical protein